MKTYKFNFDLDAWIDGVEIEADSLDEAKEKLYGMSFEELVDKGYVKQFDISGIDYEEDEDLDFDEDFDDDFDDEEIDNLLKEFDDEDLTADSKQKQVADSFAKRYKK